MCKFFQKGARKGEIKGDDQQCNEGACLCSYQWVKNVYFKYKVYKRNMTLQCKTIFSLAFLTLRCVLQHMLFS